MYARRSRRGRGHNAEIQTRVIVIRRRLAMPCSKCNHLFLEHDKFGCKHAGCSCKPDEMPKSILPTHAVFTGYEIPSPEFNRLFQSNPQKGATLAILITTAGLLIFIGGIYYADYVAKSMQGQDISRGYAPTTSIIQMFLPLGAGGFIVAMGVVGLRKALSSSSWM